jgi:hypothetical protein
MKVIPPTLATWMLKHLVLGDRNEALEGDLLEEFQRRRSASWYWRQVIGAILDHSNVMRAGWVTVCAVLFAAVWVCGLCLIVSIKAHSPLQMASANWIPYGKSDWIAVGIVFYLGVPLSVYLALARNLSLRAFTIGLGAGVLVVVMLPFFQSRLATPLNYVLEYGRAKHWSVVLWLRGYDLMQGCLPLIAAAWVAALSKIKMGTLGPQEARPHASEYTNN